MELREIEQANALFLDAYRQGGFPAYQILWKEDNGAYFVQNLEYGAQLVMWPDEVDALISRAQDLVNTPTPAPTLDPAPLAVIDEWGNLEGSDE